jgi:hypothetical protein
MAFAHGKKAVFKLDDSGGTLRDLSAYCDEVGFPREVETAESTTFGANSKTYIVGLADATVSVSGKFDSTADGYVAGALNALITGTATTLTFEHGPDSATAGRIKYTGESIITSYEVSAPVGDLVTFSLELQVTGDVTRTTY